MFHVAYHQRRLSFLFILTSSQSNTLLSLLRGKSGKALINLRKAENDDIVAFRSTINKNSKSLLERPTITALVSAIDAKASMTPNLWNRTWLAGTGLSIFSGKTTEKVVVKILTKHMSYVLYKFHICCFLIYAKKNKHTEHMCSGIKTLKHNVRTKLRLAYHGCENLTHTIKKRHVKRTQMFPTARFTIDVFVTFPDC